MTMLDRMRRHRTWLNWSLVLVCLAFVIFYIPDFLRGGSADAASDETVAVVQGHDIKADEFRRAYEAQIQAYRAAYGGKMSKQLMQQLGVDQQILQQMVDERTALAEAERLGITVSDEVVRERIVSMPAFQENGAFIGEPRYRQVLSSQRPPLTESEFENSVRSALTVDKLRTTVTGWLSVPDTEVEQAYHQRNDKIRLALVTVSVDSLRAQLGASDAEVSARDLAHQIAAELAVNLKAAPDFDKAAKAGGVEAKTTDLITRDSRISDLGLAPEVIAAAFKLPQNAVSDPIAIDKGGAILKVIDKQEPTARDVTEHKDRVREELLTDRQNRLFTAFMAKAKQKMRIEVNRQALQRVAG